MTPSFRESGTPVLIPGKPRRRSAVGRRLRAWDFGAQRSWHHSCNTQGVPLRPQAAPDLAQFLTFSVAEEEYGISILTVQEILDRDAFANAPRTPDSIPSLINLRGRLVPVVDLAVRFGLAPRPVTERTAVVIVEVDRNGERLVMGLRVDAVHPVVELGPAEIEAPPSFGTRVDVACLTGLGHAGGRSVLLLDIDRLLSPGEAARR